ncbi:hypothetical protein WME90_09860 [Sorangium sp. So ce375]|uniref:hypothetical protein n=1 Tax=Sorangium sp. So ce375 TaxID=3133306 RepID=UPI003F5C8E29
MRRMTGLLSLALLAPLSSLAWLGCQTIAGIEDRTFDPGGAETGGGHSEPPPVSDQCKSYCADVMANCTEEHQVYSTLETCYGVCALLPAGDSLEPVDNTVACRARQAELAGATGEVAVHCPAAGPGGGGECGTNCESYCALRAAACTLEVATEEECVAKCAGLKDVKTFDVIENHDGDTLQCRLVHVSSATVDPDEHCPHASLTPVTPCADPDGTAPSCEDFCQVVMTSCTGDLAVYESRDQCLSVCAALPPGGAEDRTENTVGCRKYHAYSAMLAPTNHCPHTGPGGDGHCGVAEPGSDVTGNCVSYCTLFEAACKETLGEAYDGWGAACQGECSTMAGAATDSGYSVASAEGGDTVSCWLLHVSRAFENPDECLALAEGTACP